MDLNIFTYTDYRLFLKESYVTLKRVDKKFSYRFLANKAGFASPNFLKLVIDGRRNLSADSIVKIAKALKLTRKEHRFFGLLVGFNQASSPSQKDFFYQQLLEFPECCSAHELAREQYEYLTNWFYPVIQELVLVKGFKEDAEWISKKLGRTITTLQARQALMTLEKLKLLVREDDMLKPAQINVTTGDSPTHVAAYHFHEQMIGRTHDALEKQTSDKREFGAITMAVDKKMIGVIKEEIRSFRKRILNIVSQDDNQHREMEAVYQLNIYLFGHTDVSMEGKTYERK